MKNINKSARNIKNVKLIKDEGTNIYDLFKYKNIIITSSSAKIQERVLNEKINYMTQLDTQLLLKRLQFYLSKIKQFLKFMKKLIKKLLKKI